MHVKIQADYAERNDGERVMTMPTTPIRHSPAFDIVAKARGRRSDRVLGMDGGQPLKAYKVHSTTRRQGPEKGSKGGLNGTVHGLFCWVLSAGFKCAPNVLR